MILLKSRREHGFAKGKHQEACKPGSVSAHDMPLRHQLRGSSHSSRRRIAATLKQPTRISRSETLLSAITADARPLFGLAPGGVCHASAVASTPVRFYRTLSPLPVRLRRGTIGGLLSVALSLGVWPFSRAPGGRYPPPLFRGARTFLVHVRTRLPRLLMSLHDISQQRRSAISRLIESLVQRIGWRPAAHPRPSNPPTQPAKVLHYLPVPCAKAKRRRARISQTTHIPVLRISTFLLQRSDKLPDLGAIGAR